MEKTENKFGVTNTLEVIDTVTLAFIELSATVRGGNPSGTGVILKLAKLLVPIQAAVKDIDQMDDELKNLSESEFKEKIAPRLVNLAYAIYKDTIANVA